MSKTSGIKCPHCDAPLEYDGSSRYVTCEYCGSKVEVTGENEIVFHKIDEAAVQKTKTEREVRLKELDVQNAIDARDTVHHNWYTIIWGGIVAACLVAGLLGNEDMLYLAFFAAFIGFCGKYVIAFFRRENEKEAREERERKAKLADGYLLFPEDLAFSLFQTVNAPTAVDILKNAGFKNVQTVNLRDLKDGSQMDKKGIISHVIIDGKEAKKNDVFLPDSVVQVQFHDYSELLSTYIMIPSKLAYPALYNVTVSGAVEMLQTAGFTNINTVNLRDLKESSEKKRKDTVAQVVIDGKNVKEYQLYPPKGNIQVQYHDFTEEYYNNPVRVAMSAVSSKIRSRIK
ncbi:MAG: hypothetical protein IJI45_13255 [Anaerolineaceae bacterium]|nr:hypothetical protein [Anaerolineaceae bacterium]